MLKDNLLIKQADMSDQNGKSGQKIEKLELMKTSDSYPDNEYPVKNNILLGAFTD